MQYQKILGQEKTERLAKKANELRDKYINKSAEELRLIAMELLGKEITKSSLAEAKYVLRMRDKILIELYESSVKK